MKKQKLDSIKVESFRTTKEVLNKRTIYGGEHLSYGTLNYPCTRLCPSSDPCVGIFSEVNSVLAWQQTIAVTC